MGQIALEREHALRIAVPDLDAGFQAIADFHTYFRPCPHGERVSFELPRKFGVKLQKNELSDDVPFTKPPIAGAQCNAEYVQQIWHD